jgi:hypothetical protein
MNDHLRRAMRALEAGTVEVRELSGRSASQVRRRLRQTVEEVLEHLEAEEESGEVDPTDIVGRLERQSQEIAEDLRRVERLMKSRMGRD